MSIISVQKAKKRMPASGIRYKSLEQQETGKNNEDDGDNTEHDVCQTIFLFLLLGAASGDFAATHSLYGFAEGFLAAVCAANEARHGA